MKKLMLLPIIAICCGSVIAQNVQQLAIGSSIPMADKKMKSVDGKEYSIKDMADKKGVLIMFSCNTCPVVAKYQSRALLAIKEARQNGFGVIIINSNEAQRSNEDSYQSMQAYAKAHGYNNVPYVVDNNSALADAFGATRTPECYLFNASGKLVYHGAIDNNQEAAQATRNHIFSAISETTSGKEVSVKESRSVGCAIKRIL